MLRSVKVLDQTGSECALLSSCVKSIRNHETFQSIFQSLDVSAGLSLRRVQLKASATAPETAAVDVPDVTANISDVVELVRRAEEYDPCVVTFVVTKSTEAVSPNLPATAVASRTAARSTAAHVTAISADESRLAEAVELPEVRAAATAAEASYSLPVAEPASRPTINPAAASTSAAALAAASAPPEAVFVPCAAATGTAQISKHAAAPVQEITTAAHVRPISTPPSVPTKHVISDHCVTGEQGVQQCMNRIHSARASPLADFLLSKSCSFWTCDTTELQEQVFTAIQQVIFSVTPALYAAVMAHSASRRPDVTEGLHQAAPLLGSPSSGSTGSAPESIDQAAAAVSGGLLAVSRNTAVLRVLVRNSWHPVRMIFHALSELMVSYSQRGRSGRDITPETDIRISLNLVLPRHPERLQHGGFTTPPLHVPLLRALEAAPPPRPWRACAMQIVQLSVDWYLQPEGASQLDFRHEISLAMAGIQQGEARLPFPVGIIGVDTSEWLRGSRWYLWRLPQAPREEQLAAHKAMQHALLGALTSGASPAALGTPAVGPPGADGQTSSKSAGGALAPADPTLHASQSARGSQVPCTAADGSADAARDTAALVLAAPLPQGAAAVPAEPALQDAAAAPVPGLFPASAAPAPGAVVTPSEHPAPGPPTAASPAAAGPPEDAPPPAAPISVHVQSPASAAATANCAPAPAAAAKSSVAAATAPAAAAATSGQTSQHSDEAVPECGDHVACDQRPRYTTRRWAMQLYSDQARAASAGRLADFLLANGCHAIYSKLYDWDDLKLVQLAFKDVHKVLHSVTTSLYTALMKCANDRDTAPDVCDAMAAAQSLFGLQEAEGDDQRSVEQVAEQVDDCLHSVRPHAYSVLERDAWQPVLRILLAVSALLIARFGGRSRGAHRYHWQDPSDEEEEELYVSPGGVAKRNPHRPFFLSTNYLPEAHMPLQRALESTPPPRPWQACAANIVQLSVDWYLLYICHPPEYFMKSILEAVEDIESMRAGLPFPVGMAAVQTLDRVRPWRWYLWRLPDASEQEQRAAHEDMRAALTAALDSGASPVAIGTPGLQSVAPTPPPQEPPGAADGPTAEGSAHLDSVTCGLKGSRITGDQAAKLYSDEARSTSARLLADLLASKGCLFWACDSPALREEVFRAVHQVLHGVTPELHAALRRDRRAAASTVREALWEFGSVLGRCWGSDDDEPCNVNAVKDVVREDLSCIESNASLHRVLMRENWQPVASILGALHEIFTSVLVRGQQSTGAAAVAERDVEQGVRVPGYIPVSGPLRTPARHRPLLRALEAAPPPEPWHAATSHIVQLSVDWYLHPDSASGRSEVGDVNGLMLAAVDDIRKQKALLPFPVGIVAVDTSEWLRGKRWYLWRLPWAPRKEQLAAHSAMRQALLTVLLYGTSPAAIGTPAAAPSPAAANPVNAAAGNDSTAVRGSKRKASPAATEAPAQARARIQPA